jgi:hypothetical protein
MRAAQARYDAAEPAEGGLETCPRRSGEGCVEDRPGEHEECPVCEGEGEVRS